MAKITLIKFGAEWCAACHSMVKAKVFEKFKEKHPEVDIKLYDLPSAPIAAAISGEALDEDALAELQDEIPAALHGLSAAALVKASAFKDYIAPFADADQEAEDRDVKTIPAIIFEDEDGKELARREDAMSLSALEKLYKEALGEK